MKSLIRMVPLALAMAITMAYGVQGFQLRPPWGAAAPLRPMPHRVGRLWMKDTVVQEGVGTQDPRVDAWALLVDAASGRKGPRNIKAPRPPEGFVNIVHYRPSGKRGSRLKPSVKDPEMEKLIVRLWRQLCPELHHLTALERADVRLALEVALFAHRGQVRHCPVLSYRRSMVFEAIWMWDPYAHVSAVGGSCGAACHDI